MRLEEARRMVRPLLERDAQRVRLPRLRSVELPPDSEIEVRWAIGRNAHLMKGSTRAWGPDRGHVLLWLPIDKLFRATESGQRLPLNLVHKRTWYARWWWSEGYYMDASLAGIGDASGQIVFTDGRHRQVTAWQLGERFGPVYVPPEDVERVLELVPGGKRLNESRLEEKRPSGAALAKARLAARLASRARARAAKGGWMDPVQFAAALEGKIRIGGRYYKAGKEAIDAVRAMIANADSPRRKERLRKLLASVKKQTPSSVRASVRGKRPRKEQA